MTSTKERIENIAVAVAKERTVAVVEQLEGGFDLSHSQVKVLYDHLYSTARDAMYRLLTNKE